MNHSTGLKPSPLHKRRRYAAVHMLLGSGMLGPLPQSSDLRSKCPAIMDQGSGEFGTGSCTGHSGAGGANCACACAGTPLPFVASPRGLYDDARLEESPVLTDEGATIADVIQAMANNGVRAIKAPTSDGRYSDCEPANINIKPTLAEDEESARDLLVGAYAIDTTTSDVDQTIARVLGTANRPVLIGIQVDDAFEAWGNGWFAGKAPLGGVLGQSVGGHAVLVVGHEVQPDGSIVLIIRNSWSEQWGEAGCIRVTAGWLKSALMEAYALTVSLKPADAAVAVAA